MYKRAITPDELYHHGIKGQKWGIRRFQKKDGTRTAAGKAKQRKERLKKAAAGVAIAGAAAGTGLGIAKAGQYGAFDRTIKKGKGKENTSAAEEITKSTKNIITDTSSMVRSFGNTQKEIAKTKYKDEAKSLSDEELRKRINRINLEKQYVDVNTRDIRTGYDKAADILALGGTMAGAAASIAIVASTIRGLKNK